MRAQLLNILGQNEAALAGSSGPTDGLSAPFYMTDDRSGNPYIIPYIHKNHNRGNNPNNNWSSSGYWTTFYTYYSSTNDAIQRYGFARPHTTKGQTNPAHRNGGQHLIQYAKNSTINPSCDWKVSSNNTSYGPWGSVLLFLKNTNASATSCTYNAYNSNYYSSGHDGGSATLYTPNSSTKSSVSSVSISQIYSRTSGNSYYNQSGSFTIAAGATVALVSAVTANYHTTFSSGGHWTYVHSINTLGQLFPAGVIPDYDMYATVYMATSPHNGTNYLTSFAEIAQDWVRCSQLFGD